MEAPIQVPIDSGGRVVVPKRIRDSLGLVAGQLVEVELEGSSVRLRPVAPTVDLEEVDGVVVARSRDTGVVAWTEDDERSLRESLRSDHS